jgi:glutamate/tyrosine decarboxylase-like PLP-dependent enzyme
MTAWFLGPRAEHFKLWQESFEYIFQDYANWRRNYSPQDPVVVTRERQRKQYQWIDKLNGRLDVMLAHLKAHYPFHSPRYVAHMLSEQSLPAVLGYFAGMLYNPNNVTDEAAPVTVELELEVGKLVAEMLGYDDASAWTHICSGGTTATLEALWVARSVQFLPFMVREYCQAENISLRIEMANSIERDIKDIRENAALLALKPKTAMSLLDRLVNSTLRPDSSDADKRRELQILNEKLATSRYNVRARGLAEVYKNISETPTTLETLKQPRIFAPATAHYSLEKIANILGYGTAAVSLIPVDEHFRMDVEVLEQKIIDLRDDEYIAAVVGIVGTTEEGAVDSIHRILALRTKIELERNRSFWLHVDAAWGGYISSVFRGVDISSDCDDVAKLSQLYLEKMNIADDFTRAGNLFPPAMKQLDSSTKIAWADWEVYASFLSMKDAESIVVDPHKLGYIPYPAGMVSFRDDRVTQLTEQTPEYISANDSVPSGAPSAEQHVRQIGAHILEGSKPGAAATACWLAHETIPLTRAGHGKIIKTSLLNAQRLAIYLAEHRNSFEAIERELGYRDKYQHPFTFEVLATPDTNIVVFVAIPMHRQHGDRLVRTADWSLSKINEMNHRIYNELSIAAKKSARDSIVQEYFVSRTVFKPARYSSKSLKKILDRLEIELADYEASNLFVLRSTVMNPFYFAARTLEDEERMDYLYDFVKILHRKTRGIRDIMAQPDHAM